MSRILCTFPGKFGDLLWALPTVRAIAEAAGEPVNLQIAGRYGAIAALLRDQPYLDVVIGDPNWSVQNTAPISPRTPPDSWPDAIHLGYQGWPDRPLAEYVYEIARLTPFLAPLDLARPWIRPPHTVSEPAPGPRVWVGWSEEHFELKVGLLLLLATRFRCQPVEFWWLRPWQGRYDEIDHQFQIRDSFEKYSVFGPKVGVIRCDWSALAALAATCTCYLGCLSAPWVLANALGLPTVICEPNPQRHHPIFWRQSPKNTLVLGNDGKPTWDSRHVGDALQATLEAVHV